MARSAYAVLQFLDNGWAILPVRLMGRSCWGWVHLRTEHVGLTRKRRMVSQVGRGAGPTHRGAIALLEPHSQYRRQSPLCDQFAQPWRTDALRQEDAATFPVLGGNFRTGCEFFRGWRLDGLCDISPGRAVAQQNRWQRTAP